jgi:hypothetical protein
VLGLEQPHEAVREKMSAPFTPVRVNGESTHAEGSGRGAQGSTLQARVLDLVLSRPPPLCYMRNPSLTNELYRNPYQHPPPMEV